MKELLYQYNNISDFYADVYSPTPDGDIARSKEFLAEENPRFRGLSNDEILKSKYGYVKGLDTLKELDLNLDLGGSSRKYVYDEFDGDDMNYDRLLDGFPPMRKRVKSYGIGSGRLVNIYIVISENCNINYEEMIYKSHTAMRIIDMLENIGYRVAVWACDCTEDYWGSFREEKNVRYEVRVCLKRHEDSLNKALILNGISPWFFRYFMFAHQAGHYMAGPGLGCASNLNVEQTKENIIINKGECLSKYSADIKIQEIEKLFKVDLIRYAMNSSYMISHIVVYKDRFESYDTKKTLTVLGNLAIAFTLLILLS